MAAFAASTTRVRLGQMCTCMATATRRTSPRSPRPSTSSRGGRVEMGIGGGWYEHEWRAYGYGFPSAGERLAMLDEGVQIMRQACGATAGPRSTASTTRSTARSAAETVAGGRHPAVDRRRRREEDAPHRGEVRAVHELRRHAGDVRAQVGGARAALRGRGSRLRRDHPVGELSTSSSGATRPRSADSARVRSRTTTAVLLPHARATVLARVPRQAGRRHAGAGGRSGCRPPGRPAWRTRSATSPTPRYDRRASSCSSGRSFPPSRAETLDAPGRR